MIERAYDRPSAAYRSELSAGHPDRSAVPLVRMSDFQQLVHPLEEWITNYPAAALASAFLVGVALACWIKRK
jgi:hypothetical protein